LTRASDAVESATTDLLQKAECVVPNASQYSVKNPIIPYPRKRAHSTARIAARLQMLQFVSQSTHNVARQETPVKVPYICQINILVVSVYSFALLI
jgi:hypothetical protein